MQNNVNFSKEISKEYLLSTNPNIFAAVRTFVSNELDSSKG